MDHLLSKEKTIKIDNNRMVDVMFSFERLKFLKKIDL